MSKPLWPIPIKVVVLSGKNEAGKTLFATLASPDPARTRIYDLEHSSTCYNLPGLSRVDVNGKLHEKFGKAGHKPIDLWNWMVEDLRKEVTPDRFASVVIDPVSGELEQGLIDWVRANPRHFGASAQQYEAMSALAWGHAKGYYKQVLSEVAACCDTLFLIVHMGKEWSGKSPTGRLKAKGLETLLELATLYLEMNRDPDGSGRKPEKPSARVVKSRLSHLVCNPETSEWEPHPILPPRLPEATPGAIRKFIEKPLDYAKLGKQYLAPEPVISDEEKQVTQLQIAEAEAQAARDKLVLAELHARNRLEQAEAINRAAQQSADKLRQQVANPATTPPVVQQALAEAQLAAIAAVNDAVQQAEPDPMASFGNVPAFEPAPVLPAPEPIAAPPVAEAALPPGLTPVAPGKLPVSMAETLRAFRGHLAKAGMDEASWAAILAKRNAQKIEDLEPAPALELIFKLQALLAGKGTPVEVNPDGAMKSGAAAP